MERERCEGLGDMRSKGTSLMIHLLALLLVLVGPAFHAGPSLAGDAQGHVHRLVVLHTNDSHGHPLKFSYHGRPDVGGLPARATLIKRIQQENENALVLDAGDLNTGRPESTLFRAEPDILGYNHVGYDAMVLGNHEFDNRLDGLKRQMGLARFPFLAANVRTRDGRLLAPPYLIKAFDGFKVAILGLTSWTTESSADPEIIEELVFEDEVHVARRLVPLLRREADIVIALVHLGIYRSSDMGSKRLASEVSGIDLIVDGHTHTRLDAPIIVKDRRSAHKTLIVQAWHWGLVVGRTDLEIRDRKIIDHRFKLVPINLKEQASRPAGDRVLRDVEYPIQEDQGLLQLLQPYLDKIEAQFSEVIGYAEAKFRYRDPSQGETALGALVADAMLWHARKQDADFAIQNAGGIRTHLMKGPITKGLIYELLPFEDTVVVLTLQGAAAQALFDHIGGITAASGAFPQVSQGVSFTIDRHTARCKNILINGVAFDPGQAYRIATNSFLARGGDGYRMFLQATDTYDTALPQTEALIAYIKHLGGRIRPMPQGRIQFVSGRQLYNQRSRSNASVKALP